MAFLGCVLSGFAPIPPAEPYLLGLSLNWRGSALLLGAVGAAGQMISKSVYYLIGYGAVDMKWFSQRAQRRGKWQRQMERAQAWAARHWFGPSVLIFVSAAVSLPPFAATSVLAGVIKMRWWNFFLCGFAGRTIRFTAIILMPSLAGF